MSKVKRDHREELSDELVKHLQSGVLDSRRAYSYMWDDVCIGAALAQEYAQSELAALREELATAEKDRDEWRSRSTRRLADCQEMMKTLREVEGCKDTDAALLATDTLSEIMRREAVKPTESGASEPGYIGLDACVSCSGRFGEFKTCSNSLLSKAYYVECASCGAKTSGYDKAASAVKEWNSRSEHESGASE